MNLKKLFFSIVIASSVTNFYQIRAQDFYQTYKNDFLEPLKSAQAGSNANTIKSFYREQIGKLNNYRPPSLQRFISKQIIYGTNEDPTLGKECLDATFFLIKKNWIRGREKIELLKKISKVAENYQNTLKYDKKLEKIEVYKLSFLIEQELVEECLSILDTEEAKLFLSRWELASEKVRDAKINETLEQKKILYKALLNSTKKIATSLANFKAQESNVQYKKNLAMDCFFTFFSPETSLGFLVNTNATEETKMLLAYSRFLNKSIKTASEPYYFSEEELLLPPIILTERLAQYEELKNTSVFIKEQLQKNNFPFYHYARDIARDYITKFPNDSAYNEQNLTNFFLWIDRLSKAEAEETQLAFLYKLKPQLEQVKTEAKEPQTIPALTSLESSWNDRVKILEKKFKISNFRYPLPEDEPENAMEKQWNAKPQHERNRIINSMNDKIHKANPGNKTINFSIDPNTLALTIHRDSQFDNFAPFREIPFKQFLAYNCTNINDLSFLKGMPISLIDVSWSSLKSTASLRNMLSLRTLNIAGTQINDLSDLKGLNITNLNLNYTKIKELSALKAIPLTELSIENTAITSLSNLEYMPLIRLNANNCKQLKDIDSLEQTNLKYLRLNGCEQIRSLTPLSKLRLSELYIEETAVTDLSPISKSMLYALSFANCPNIKNINELWMMNIRNLGLNYPQLLPTIIQFNFKLRIFRMPKTPIQDLSPLKAFEELEELDLSESDNIKDLKTLKNTSLITLNLNNCKQLRSFQGIAELNIKNLYANETIEVKDLTTLQGAKVENFQIRSSELQTLKGVTLMNQLQSLDIRFNKKLRDLADLEKSNITSILINGTKPISFEPLKKMKSLTSCDIKLP